MRLNNHNASPAAARRQQGMTLIGWLLVFVFIGFVALVAMRLVPVYAEASAVGAVLESLEDEPGLTADDRSGVMSTLLKRLQINDVDNVERDDIHFERTSDGLLITVEYDGRAKLVGNLDAVAHFKQTALIRN